MRITSPAATMPSSGIREIMNAAWGRSDVIHLEVGQPDFATPPHVIAAATEAAMNGHTGYTPTAGIPQLRSALATKIRRRNGYEVQPDQVVLSNGGAQGIYAALASLTQPGDAILLPDPAWPNFDMMAALLGLQVAHYPLNAAGGYVPDIDELTQLVTPRTRVLLVNSPSNPLGSVISPERMAALVAFAVEHDLWLLSDECYDEITFDGPAVSPATFDPDGRVISVYSFSKTYAMTGWRLGYVAAPPAVAKVLEKAQEPLISCLNTPTQYAALAALESETDVITTMVAAYRQRRDVVVADLTARGMTVFRPAGAFYAWVDITACGESSRAFALRLLSEEGVATAPGSAFGTRGEGYLRISLAADLSDLKDGCARVTALWQRMKEKEPRRDGRNS